MSRALISREIMIEAPADRVWEFIATEEGLRQWWGNCISIEPMTGGRCAETVHMQGEVHYLRGTVTVYDPPRHLQLVLQPEPPFEQRPQITTISITVQQEAHESRVTVVHTVECVRLPMHATANAPTPISSTFSSPQMAVSQRDARGATAAYEFGRSKWTVAIITARSERTQPPVSVYLNRQSATLWASRLASLQQAILAY